MYERPRTVLPEILNAYGCIERGVEVGVCKGEFSEVLLQNWPGTLWLVDPYASVDGYPEHYDHERNREAMCSRVRPFGARAILLRSTSLEAATTFRDGELDFVYLDADHRYERVREDLHAWWPKIRAGGIFAGDDYGPLPITQVDFGKGAFLFGVKAAVDEFALEVRRNVSIDLLAQWGGAGWMARNWWMVK